ncbi:universal stress protein [Natrinema ejinorense]|uniref:Universal stress protein n=1 Tax=Natrinema ejinorense TaxID=373386 RepID=A0A2A5QQ36_9EURY|nr:universal stress protein [Natrinema ejinorense]PCR88978.1 universal stress protein [Natrinema ejinorense]
MYDTILVATDGSDAANRAVEHATDLASSFDADLHTIYVVDTTRYGKSVLSDAGGALDDLEERGAGILEDVAARSDVDVTTEIRSGRPDEEIDSYAAAIEADLVVLGNRGLGSGPGEELGSVAERVVRNAGRPVITA